MSLPIPILCLYHEYRHLYQYLYQYRYNPEQNFSSAKNVSIAVTLYPTWCLWLTDSFCTQMLFLHSCLLRDCFSSQISHAHTMVVV